jgi:mannose/cellobiose epimerase-like protein (N-acyl-D-glucosamine 2-epimerase family)
MHPHSTTVTSYRELARLIDFAKASAVPGGFGFLDRFGAVEKNRSPACFVTARMTYCFSIASLLGMPDVERYATHGVASLSGAFRDEAYGGYVSSLDRTPAAQRKRAYDTCFVALAASSAATAGIPGAKVLTADVSDVLQARFWSNEAGALVESWDREFAEPEPYWGANANMHGLEALLALYGYTRNTMWRELGLRIAETFINTRARSAKWWLNEHYGPDWTAMPGFNADNPRHEFHPYGMTPGHLFEWSRLLLQLESTFEQPPAWLREAAAGLYETAVKHGWAADGKGGFVYTVDWDGEPVIRDRPHWVTAEAISAAATWIRLTGSARYANHLQQWANFAQMHFIDTEHGSWHPLLDPNNRPSYTMWSGKPDIYHALQAILLPKLPVAESTARAIMTAGNGSCPSFSWLP